MKKIIRIIRIIILIVIISLSYFVFNIFIKKQDVKNKEIFIEKNESISSIYKELNIRYGILDKIFFKYTKEARNIKAGNFIFDENLTKYNIIKQLRNPNNNITLSIPEGFTSNQVLDRIENLGLATKKDMLNEMEKYDFYYKHNDVFEGYFYPATYYFTRQEKPKDILDTIFSNFLEKYPVEKYDREKFYNQLILASIIEKEAGNDEDRKKVAGVFYNRLVIDMPLQSDATLKYELNRKVYKKDLLTSNSRYNTYKHKGLTPSPISNPSEKSIDAAINPDKNNYLYFFMYDGKTYYSKTHNEHLRKRKESGHIK